MEYTHAVLCGRFPFRKNLLRWPVSTQEAAMGDWYRVIKETGPGRQYLYLQRTYRVPGRKNPVPEDMSLGRWNANPVPRPRRAFSAAEYEQSAGGLGLLLFGYED